MNLFKTGISMVALSLMLASCSSPARLQTLTVQAPANLAASCPKIDQPELKTMGDLLQFANNLINQYSDCSDRHDALVKSWPTNN